MRHLSKKIRFRVCHSPTIRFNKSLGYLHEEKPGMDQMSEWPGVWIDFCWTPFARRLKILSCEIFAERVTTYIRWKLQKNPRKRRENKIENRSSTTKTNFHLENHRFHSQKSIMASWLPSQKQKKMMGLLNSREMDAHEPQYHPETIPIRITQTHLGSSPFYHRHGIKISDKCLWHPIYCPWKIKITPTPSMNGARVGLWRHRIHDWLIDWLKNSWCDQFFKADNNENLQPQKNYAQFGMVEGKYQAPLRIIFINPDLPRSKIQLTSGNRIWPWNVFIHPWSF